MAKQVNVIVKMIMDFLLLCIVGFPILIIFLKGKPAKRGFFCDDDSIRYPFEESTITDTVLYLVGIFVPTICITVVEFYNYMKQQQVKETHTFRILGKRIPSFVWKLYIEIGFFLFGACMSQLSTDIAKYTIGRLRPHFFDVCQPDVDCLSGDPHRYITDYRCQNLDANKIKQARLSFPSGHSSFSAYTMVYLVIYIQARMQVPANRLLKPFLQFLLVTMAWFTALSRVHDNKHHWSDVLFGSLSGTLVAVLEAYFVSDLFTSPMKKKDEESIASYRCGSSQLPNYNTMDLEQQTSS